MTREKIISLAARALRLCVVLSELLEKEGEKNWARGVKEVMSYLNVNEAMSEAELVDSLRNAWSAHKTMNAGYGSFSDFFIWRDDPADRIKANELLVETRERLSSIMKEIHVLLSSLPYSRI